jgi:hypothetical protein
MVLGTERNAFFGAKSTVCKLFSLHSLFQALQNNRQKCSCNYVNRLNIW